MRDRGREVSLHGSPGWIATIVVFALLAHASLCLGKQQSGCELLQGLSGQRAPASKLLSVSKGLLQAGPTNLRDCDGFTSGVSYLVRSLVKTGEFYAASKLCSALGSELLWSGGLSRQCIDAFLFLGDDSAAKALVQWEVSHCEDATRLGAVLLEAARNFARYGRFLDAAQYARRSMQAVPTADTGSLVVEFLLKAGESSAALEAARRYAATMSSKNANAFRCAMLQTFTHYGAESAARAMARRLLRDEVLDMGSMEAILAAAGRFSDHRLARSALESVLRKRAIEDSDLMRALDVLETYGMRRLATKFYEEAIESGRLREAEGRFKLGALLARDGKWKAADSWFGQYVDARSAARKGCQARTKVARFWTELGKADRALTFLRNTDCVQDRDYLKAKVTALAKAGKEDAVWKTMVHGAQAGPGGVDYWSWAGQALREAGLHDLAVRAYRSALRVAKSPVAAARAKVALASVLKEVSSGEEESIARLLISAAKEVSEDVGLRKEILELAKTLKQREMVEVALREAMAASGSTDPDLWMQLGTSYVRAHEPIEAATAYLQALKFATPAQQPGLLGKVVMRLRSHGYRGAASWVVMVGNDIGIPVSSAMAYATALVCGELGDVLCVEKMASKAIQGSIDEDLDYGLLAETLARMHRFRLAQGALDSASKAGRAIGAEVLTAKLRTLIALGKADAAMKAVERFLGRLEEADRISKVQYLVELLVSWREYGLAERLALWEIDSWQGVESRRLLELVAHHLANMGERDALAGVIKRILDGKVEARAADVSSDLLWTVWSAGLREQVMALCKRFDTSPGCLMFRARLAAEKGDFKGLSEQIAKVAANVPPKQCGRLAVELSGLGAPHEALLALERCQKVEPSLHILMADIEARSGDLAKARWNLLQALEGAKEHEELLGYGVNLERLAGVLARVADPKVKSAAMALEKRSRNKRSRFRGVMAWAYLWAGLVDDAVDIARSVAAVRQGREWFMRFVHALDKAGRPDQSLELVRWVLNQKGSIAGAGEEILGKTCSRAIELGQLDLCDRLLGRYMRDSQGAPSARAVAARVYLQVGLTDKALATVRTSPDASGQLAPVEVQALLASDNTSDALRSAWKVLHSMPREHDCPTLDQNLNSILEAFVVSGRDLEFLDLYRTAAREHLLTPFLHAVAAAADIRHHGKEGLKRARDALARAIEGLSAENAEDVEEWASRAVDAALWQGLADELLRMLEPLTYTKTGLWLYGKAACVSGREGETRFMLRRLGAIGELAYPRGKLAGARLLLECGRFREAGGLALGSLAKAGDGWLEGLKVAHVAFAAAKDQEGVEEVEKRARSDDSREGLQARLLLAYLAQEYDEMLRIGMSMAHRNPGKSGFQSLLQALVYAKDRGLVGEAARRLRLLLPSGPMPQDGQVLDVLSRHYRWDVARDLLWMQLKDGPRDLVLRRALVSMLMDSPAPKSTVMKEAHTLLGLVADGVRASLLVRLLSDASRNIRPVLTEDLSGKLREYRVLPAGAGLALLKAAVLDLAMGRKQRANRLLTEGIEHCQQARGCASYLGRQAIGNPAVAWSPLLQGLRQFVAADQGLRKIPAVGFALCVDEKGPAGIWECGCGVPGRRLGRSMLRSFAKREFLRGRTGVGLDVLRRLADSATTYEERAEAVLDVLDLCWPPTRQVDSNHHGCRELAHTAERLLGGVSAAYDKSWKSALAMLVQVSEGKETAVGMMESYLGVEPADGQARNNFGYLLSVGGLDAEQGVDQARLSQALSPDDRKYAVETEAWALYLAGHKRQAVSRMRQALRLVDRGMGEGAAEAYYHAGLLFSDAGMQAESREAFRRAAAIGRNTRFGFWAIQRLRQIWAEERSH